jgi:hypothetical protein
MERAKQMATPEAPSVLQSPRFFDDEALSAWELHNRTVVEAKSEFVAATGALPVAAADNLSNSHPLPKYDEDSIGVELVRGFHGPADDTWTVLVDGVVHVEGQTLAADPDDPTTFACTLPSAVSERIQRITTETRARQLVFGVRLEQDALAPLSATLSLMQVLHTDEYDDTTEIEETQMRPPAELKPYRVGTHNAPCVTMMYPFWAPAQSALGILSFEDIERDRERKRWNIVYNGFANAANSVVATAYDARKFVYFTRNLGTFASNVTTTGINTFQQVAANVSGERMDPKDKFSKLKYSALPKKPTEFRRRFDRIGETGGDSSAPDELKKAGMYIIGGGNKSAAFELAEMFKLLTEVCKGVRKKSEEAAKEGWWLSTRLNKKLSLREHLALMRLAIISEYDDNDLLALFDAILSADPVPSTSLMFDQADLVTGSNADPALVVVDGRRNINADIRPMYVLKERTAAAAKPDAPPDDLDVEAYKRLTPDQRLNVQAANQQRAKKEFEAQKNGSSKAPYMFLFERLQWENRRRTSVKTVAVVKLIDNDGSTKTVRFEAERESGYAAHAVYSNLAQDIEDMDQEAKAFVDCLFEAYFSGSSAPRKVLGVTIPSLPEVRFWERISNWTLGSYRGRAVSEIQQGVAFTNLFQVLKFAGTAGVDWMAMDDPWYKRWFGFTPKASKFQFKITLDPLKMEERIGELRLMVRETMPLWPAQVDTGPVSDELMASVKKEKEALGLAPRVRVVDRSAASAPAAVPGAAASTSAVSLSAPSAPKAQDMMVDRLHGSSLNKWQTAPTAEYSFEELRDMAAVDEEERQRQEKFEQDVADEIRRQYEFDELRTDAAEQLRAKGFASYEKESSDPTRLLVRQLPHLVTPYNNLQFSFADYKKLQVVVDRITEPVADGKSQFIGAAALGITLGIAGYFGLVKVTLFVAEYTKDYIQTLQEKQLLAKVIERLFTSDINGVVGQLLQSTITDPALVLPVLTAGLEAGLGLEKNSLLRSIGDALVYNRFVPLGVSLAGQTYAWTNARLNASKEKMNVYEYFRRKLIGKPATSAVQSASYAIRNFRMQEKELLKSLGVADLPTVVHNLKAGSRFVFLEHYELPAALTDTKDREAPLIDEVLQNMRPLYKNVEWLKAPDGSAALLLPPADVSERMYEVEVLRDIPLSQFAKFVTGSAPGPIGMGAGSGSSEVDAFKAASEMWHVILRSRRELSGQHIVESPEQTLQKLSASASRIISAAFGEGALTLVDGDDILWSCVRGGIPARLALRHSTLFQKAELEYNDTTPDQRVAKYGSFWKHVRRSLMAQFSKAVSDSPKLYAAQKKAGSTPWRAEALPALVQRVASSFARVSALASSGQTKLDRDAAFAAIASAAAHRLILSNVTDLHKISAPLDKRSDYSTMDMVIELIDIEYKRESAFRLMPNYSELLEQSKDPSARATANSQLRRAVWAARRIDTMLSRDMQFSDGVDALVGKLAGMNMEDRGGARTYYLPVGDNLDTVNAHAPVFSSVALGARELWLEQLQSACEVLSSCIQDVSTLADLRTTKPAQQPSGVLVDTTLLGASGLVGVQRHPLTLTTAKNEVFVHLSSSAKLPSNIAKETPHTTTGDFKTAASLIFDGGIDPYLVRERVQRSRMLGYNAERLFFALSLADTLSSEFSQLDAPSVILSRVTGNDGTEGTKDTDIDRAFSLAIALCLKASREGSLIGISGLYVKNPSEVHSSLKTLAKRIGKTVADGCLVATLSEVVQCM